MSHDENTPDEVWEQDVANGGAVDGELPRAAVPTLPQGVSTVRLAPTLRHTTGAVQLVEGGTFSLGREPRRRRLLVSVSATAPAYVIAGDSRDQAAGEYGLIVPPGAVVTLHTADALWFCAVGGAAVLSWLSELDQD